MMSPQKKFDENRRDFLRKFTLLGGMGAAGTLTGSAAVNWLRESAPEGNGVLVRIDPDPATAPFAPLDEIHL
ncbi:MAG TPA: twin-arginine translocation signal domain-containing protein, partial [Bacteroides sp.]|nr:twin-arginine translocation signal domain-containing protein [Bacteroides sp.]